MVEIFNSITAMIKEYDNVLIITHKNPDFDGLGSALGLQSVIKSFNKNSKIYLNKENLNVNIEKSIKQMITKKVDIDIIYDLADFKNYLLIIMDTHKQSLVENLDALNHAQKVVIIDHHIKSKDFIKGDLIYINSTLSSTVEFVTMYLKYLNKVVNPMIATAMLAGLEIDTNSFNFKTSEKTYEAASSLASMGADNVLKQEFLKIDKETYVKRQKLIETSYMLDKNIALCVSDTNIYEPSDLAKISDELLQFENVEASFTIGKIAEDTVGISARSLGKFNVEEIMRLLKGGGHMTEAATQLKMSLTEAKQLLIKAIGGEL